MKVVSKEQFLKGKSKYCARIKDGAVFIYPTDTIYGIGCDATNDDAVKRIRMIKRRDTKPFSIAAPSTGWIKQNCVLNAEAKRWVERLPGPFTFLLKLKKKAVSHYATKNEILGVRIPDNWFSEIITELGFPIVSTSANITKENHMTSLDDLNKQVAEQVDFIVYDGQKDSLPSTLIDLTKKKSTMIQR